MKHAFPAFGLLACLVFLPGSAYAQVGGGTDHFKCYIATESTLEPPLVVSLEDQFGERPDVTVYNAGLFCNPVEKTFEEVTTPIAEPLNHLTLYPIGRKGPEPARLVTVENQFGVQDLVLTAPRLLAVPTEKDDLGAPAAISHFLCYEAHNPSLHDGVSLEDQFHTEEGDVLGARYFCNPASKTTADGTVTEPEPDEDHLTCYKITPSDQPPVDFVDIDNQFDEDDTLRIEASQLLCVPSAKLEVGRPSDRAHEEPEPAAPTPDLGPRDPQSLTE